MDWDDVRYFLDLARTGSLSGASRTRGVEHTTIARRVASLETTLDVRLFDRLPRGWRLTDAGRALIPVAETLEADALEFERRALGVAGLSGSVRVSAPPVLVTHFLVTQLPAFTTRHPEICVEFSADRRGANLLRGEAEVALRVGAVDVPPGLIVRELGRIGYGLYGTAELLALPPQRYVFVGLDDSMRGALQRQWLENYAAKRPITFRSNELIALLEAARRGLGIALLPHFCVAPSDGLQLLLSDEAAFERPLSLLLHPDVRRSPRVAAMVDFLVRLTRKHAALLQAPNGSIATRAASTLKAKHP
jgi:DNA-binding transcriptional LysR family regulator